MEKLDEGVYEKIEVSKLISTYVGNYYLGDSLDSHFKNVFQ